ncbi:hypothetical protein BGZ63DRAFT_387581 [Mariannaea sp. PMI_226]|nr:hypothetical protein BGZ63DRAFT_387581 [Mariannaea sp. PMI_226]
MYRGLVNLKTRKRRAKQSRQGAQNSHAKTLKRNGKQSSKLYRNEEDHLIKWKH